jgi:uncharacterized membrane protein YjfL (UPF0719 family)
MHELGLGVLTVLAYAAVGLLLLVAGYSVLDALTPGRLMTLIYLERNVNAARITIAQLASVTIVVASAALTSVGGRFGALVDMGVFGLLALLLQAVCFWTLDALTPGDLGDIVTQSEPHPAALVTAAWTLAIGVLLAVAIV